MNFRDPSGHRADPFAGMWHPTLFSQSSFSFWRDHSVLWGAPWAMGPADYVAGSEHSGWPGSIEEYVSGRYGDWKGGLSLQGFKQSSVGMRFALPGEFGLVGTVFTGVAFAERALVALTWELPQTIVGLAFLGALAVAGIPFNADVREATLQITMTENRNGGMSFGAIVVFGYNPNAPDDSLRVTGPTMRDSELAHSVQSLALGPAYLPLIGLSWLIGWAWDGDTHGPHSYLEAPPHGGLARVFP